VKPNVGSSSSPMIESVKSFSSDTELLHLINYTHEAQTVTLAGDFENLTDQTDASGLLNLKSFGTAILKRK